MVSISQPPFQSSASLDGAHSGALDHPFGPHPDGLEDEDGGRCGEGDVGLHAAWQAATSADPAEELVATIDLDIWLGSLGDDDRDLLAGRLAGHSLQELAWRTNRSITAVFGHLRQLGTDLAAFAGIPVKKKIRRERRHAAAQCCRGLRGGREGDSHLSFYPSHSSRHLR
jgi:hypothetical protein